MRYAQIRNMDISNGEGIGVALFVQGCHFQCYNCFNSEAWDFKGGYEWSEDEVETILKLMSKSYVQRTSILGGEPFADENIQDVLNLVIDMRTLYPTKRIWIYTGYIWEELIPQMDFKETSNMTYIYGLRKQLLKKCDVLIDGKYIDELKDFSQQWRGSSNQRVIDIKKSLEKGRVVLYCD